MKQLLLVGIVCAAGTAAAVAQDGPWFAGVGEVPGGLTQSSLQCLSPEGRFSGGASQVEPTGFGFTAFLWSQDRGLEDIGSPPNTQGYPSAALTALASQATAGAGWVFTSKDPDDREAFLWSPAAGFEVLGDLPGGNTDAFAWAISADARSVVGHGTYDNSGFYHAWRWTRETGMVDMGTLPGAINDHSLALAVSADGSVIAGASYSPAGFEAFSWTIDGGMVGLGDLPGGGFSSGVTDITPDGRVLAGYGQVDGDIWEGARWVDGGPIERIGGLPGMHTFPASVSADGKMIVGYASPLDFSASEAVIWTEAAGWRLMADVLMDDYGLGAEIAGWTLGGCRGISNDGRTISGWGYNPDGNEEGWVVSLGERCPGDFNQDDVVNTLDVLEFLNAWNAGCP